MSEPATATATLCPAEAEASTAITESFTSTSAFHAVFDHAKQRDAFHRYLEVVFQLCPADKFHRLIHKVCARHESDEAIDREVQRRLKDIMPFLSMLTRALPALFKLKGEMTRQTLELLNARRPIQGCLEIGSTGRHVSRLRHHLHLSGPVFVINDIAPGNGLRDIIERGQLTRLGQFIPLQNYAPIAPADIADGSLDLVTLYTGLHLCPEEKLDAFVQSLCRVLRPGGSLILRDYDVRAPAMTTFVALAHTVGNLARGVPWLADAAECRNFRSADAWAALLIRHGLKDSGKRLYQFMDPSDNTLMRFIKS